MYRKFVAAVALVFSAAGLFAGEYVGKVKSVDAEKNTITISSKDSGDKTIKVSTTTKFVGNKKIADQLAADGLKHPVFSRTGKKAPTVTITTTGEGDKEVATVVKVGGKKKTKKPAK